MHDIELFTTWIGLSIVCVYPVGDVKKLSSRPAELVISFFCKLELRALKLAVANELIRNSSNCMLLSFHVRVSKWFYAL